MSDGGIEHKLDPRFFEEAVIKKLDKSVSSGKRRKPGETNVFESDIEDHLERHKDDKVAQIFPEHLPILQVFTVLLQHLILQELQIYPDHLQIML